MDVLAGLAGLFDTGVNFGISQQNLDLQRQNLNYQKSVQQETWNREDTAVQRRVADLEKAGLSKTLAAGSSANSGAVVNTTPVQNTYNSALGDVANNVINAISAESQISRTMAEVENLKGTNDLLKAQLVGQMEDNLAKKNNNSLYTRTVLGLDLDNVQKSLNNAYIELQSAKTNSERSKINAEISKLNEEKKLVEQHITNYGIKNQSDTIDLARNTSDYAIEQSNGLHSKDQVTKNWSTQLAQGFKLRSKVDEYLGDTRTLSGYIMDKVIRHAVKDYQNKKYIESHVRSGNAGTW